MTHRTVPTRSLRTTCQFATSQPAEAGDNVPVTITARTGDPIEHWYWGKIVHDLEGMRHKASVPIDWMHQYDQELGYLNDFSADVDLVAHGELVPFSDGDRVHQITHRASRGVPYEASIDWSGGSTKLEELDEGDTAEVNGRTISGPATIVRQWTLTAVAICPHGADAGTSTTFAQDKTESTIEVTMPRKKIMQQTDPEPDEKEVDEPTTEEPTPAPAPGEPESATQPEPTFTKSQVKNYIDEFGTDGWEYLLAGMSREQCLAQQREQLRQEIADLQKQLAEQMEANRQLNEQMEAARKLTYVDDAVSGRPEKTESANGRRGGIVPLRQ